MRANPVSRVKLYSEKDSLKERILTKEEEERLLRAASEHFRPILLVALITGMRREQALHLRAHLPDARARGRARASAGNAAPGRSLGNLASGGR